MAKNTQVTPHHEEDEIKTPTMFKKPGFKFALYLVIALFIVLFVFQTAGSLCDASNKSNAVTVGGRDATTKLDSCVQQRLRQYGLAGESTGDGTFRAAIKSMEQNNLADAVIRECLDAAVSVTLNEAMTERVGLSMNAKIASQVVDPEYAKLVRAYEDKFRTYWTGQDYDFQRRNFIDRAKQEATSSALIGDNIVSAKDVFNHTVVNNLKAEADVILFTFEDYARIKAPNLIADDAKIEKPEDKKLKQEDLKKYYQELASKIREYPKEFQVKLISVASETEANDLLGKHQELQATGKSLFDDDQPYASRIKSANFPYGTADYTTLFDLKVSQGKVHTKAMTLQGSLAVFRVVNVTSFEFEELEKPEFKDVYIRLVAQYIASKPGEFASEYTEDAVKFTIDSIKQELAGGKSVKEVAKMFGLSRYGRTALFDIFGSSDIAFNEDSGGERLAVKIRSRKPTDAADPTKTEDFNLTKSKTFLTNVFTLKKGEWASEPYVKPDVDVESSKIPVDIHEHYGYVVGNVTYTKPDETSAIDNSAKDNAINYTGGVMTWLVRQTLSNMIGVDQNLSSIRSRYGINEGQINEGYVERLRSIIKAVPDMDDPLQYLNYF